jgi:hypothetical protein
MLWLFYLVVRRVFFLVFCFRFVSIKKLWVCVNAFCLLKKNKKILFFILLFYSFQNLVVHWVALRGEDQYHNTTNNLVSIFTWTLGNPHGIIFLHVQLGTIKKVLQIFFSYLLVWFYSRRLYLLFFFSQCFDVASCNHHKKRFSISWWHVWTQLSKL